MEKLSYEFLKKIGYNNYILESAPERVLQFGEGNFLRAFAEDFIDRMNETAGFDSKVVVCQPGSRSPAGADRINGQNGLYTLLLRGREKGQKVQEERIISCISRCLNLYRDYDVWMECARNPKLRYIICNTTEAGIVYKEDCCREDRPPVSYPAKLTQFLYERYRIFGREQGKGFVILACELIEDNGKVLKEYVLRHAHKWGLEEGFIRWLQEENVFCSTLVDRIVPGYPAQRAEKMCRDLGYEDALLDIGEPFALWVIEGPKWLKEELPFERAKLPVIICEDHRPYKQRKVRILNGAHTSMAAGAYLAGFNVVRDCMQDPVIRGFMEKAVQEEIIPTLPLPIGELKSFAASVTERFDNPFIDHALLSIALNSTAKWRARVLPSLKAYMEKTGNLPCCLTSSFAFYLAFYRGDKVMEEGLRVMRGSQEYFVKDDRAVLEFFAAHSKDDDRRLVQDVCAKTEFWGEDLGRITGFPEAVTKALEAIRDKGVYKVMQEMVEKKEGRL